MYTAFKKLITERNMSAYQVSKETGISQATLSDWKRGVSQPKVDKLLILSKFFDVPLEMFLKKGD